MQQLPSSRPKASAILRQAMPWSIQKRRTALSGLLSVNPLDAIGCEKKEGLKSSATLRVFAQSIQREKCSGAIWSRLTFFPLVSA